jgi:hypothetical protein
MLPSLPEYCETMGFEDSHYFSKIDERCKYAREARIFCTVKSLRISTGECFQADLHELEDTFKARFERKKESETQYHMQKYGTYFTSE